MIKHFTEKYAAFSNFWKIPIQLDGIEYKSLEHAYQAAKTLISQEREEIRKAMYAGQAKYLGQKVTLREDWESIKLRVMEELLIQKFSDPELSSLLAGTNNEEIIEGNYWHDTFWGVCLCDRHNGRGQNYLGKLLMKIRNDKQRFLLT